MDLFAFEWRQAAVDRRSEGQPCRTDRGPDRYKVPPCGIHDRRAEGVKRRRQHATSIRRIRVTEASVRNVLETGAA